MPVRLVSGTITVIRLPYRFVDPRKHSIRAYTITTLENEKRLSVSENFENVTKTPKLIDELVPRSRFGRSVFTTPFLLFLRLFYQAVSFDDYQFPPVRNGSHSTFRRLFQKASSLLGQGHTIHHTVLLPDIGSNSLTELMPRSSIYEWQSLLQSKRYPVNSSSTLRSMTWVKSLSAPLSHEYLQFVVECNDSGKRYRLIAERDTDGDWAYLIAANSNSSSSTQSNTIVQLRPYDYQHDLPLPLLSVSWKRIPVGNRPTVANLASILAQTTQQCPEYNVMREHCWWYAEAVFERMLGSKMNRLSPSEPRPVQPNLKHWSSGAYRYSYIVLGKQMWRRENLVAEAKAFRNEMDRGGHLRW